MCARFGLAVLALFSRALTAAPTLQFINGTYQNVNLQRVVALPNGDHLLVGSQDVDGPINAAGIPATRSAILLYALDPGGNQDFGFGVSPRTIGGSGNDIASDSIADAQGNVWIVGSTDSDDFPLMNPIVSQKVPYRTSGFIMKLDPTGRNILFSSYLGGHTAGGANRFSKATNLAIDTHGNVYILGNTSEGDFPTSPGVFGTPASLINGFQGEIYSWVLKISPAGSLVYSTLLGGSQSNCTSGDQCVGILAANIGESIGVDAAGSVSVAGVTSAQDFPVTPGAFQSACQCFPGNYAGFITRLSPDATHLIWSTYFDNLYLGAPPHLLIALDKTGDVFAFGRSQPDITTVNPLGLPPRLFYAELAPDGSARIPITDLGQSADARIAGIVIDSSGNPILAGTSAGLNVETPSGVPKLGNDFVLSLSPLSLRRRLVTGTVTRPPLLDDSGNLLLLSDRGSLLELPVSGASSEPAILGLGNAATYTMGTSIAPGEIVSLYGMGLGATSAVTATLDADGRFPKQLGGVQVLVAGVLAPLLYVSPSQINLQIPFETGPSYVAFPPIEVDGPSAKLIVRTNALPSLGLFYAGTPPFAAALNQDGTVNSASNPAKAGTVVALFGTGAVLPQWIDGAISTDAIPLSQQNNRFTVTDDFRNELWLSYAGAAPGLINGVFQINVRVPEGDVDPTLTLESVTGFGVKSSNTVQLYVH